VRKIWLSVLVASAAGNCLGQAERPCFAFLLKGDVTVACEGTKFQITRRGDVQQFAVSEEQSSFGFVTERITKGTVNSANAADTLTVIDLKTGSASEIPNRRSVVSTCGGLFSIHDARREPAGIHDLINNAEVEMKPYVWFRCSSDKKNIVGTTQISKGDLYEGMPPQVKMAPSGSYTFYTFNVSPDGSKTAYFADSRPLCVFTTSGSAQCAENSATGPDAPSVNNSGEVLVAYSTPEECFYKNAYNFSPERSGNGTKETSDACVGIGYWKPGVKSIEIIEALGRSPQWISAASATMLRAWASQASPSGRTSK
jgi:hypothetical protein